MRNAKVFCVGILIIISGTALAAGPGSPAAGSSTPNSLDSIVVPQMTTLQVSPMYLEIKDVLEQSARTEEGLLAELSMAADELEVQLIVGKIEKLDLDRDLAIMRIQARYAHQEQRWSLEKQIRSRIKELEEGRQLAVR